MVSSEQAARSQRRRWELGRFALARDLALPLLREALSPRSPILFDLALDLLVPPLSFLALFIAAGAGACALVAAASGEWPAAIVPWLASAAFVFAYVVRGWVLSGIGLRGLQAALHLPRYVIWKAMVISQPPQGSGVEWVRTAREDVLP
jgi:hypothetical protein